MSVTSESQVTKLPTEESGIDDEPEVTVEVIRFDEVEVDLDDAEEEEFMRALMREEQGEHANSDGTSEVSVRVREAAEGETSAAPEASASAEGAAARVQPESERSFDGQAPAEEQLVDPELEETTQEIILGDGEDQPLELEGVDGEYNAQAVRVPLRIAENDTTLPMRGSAASTPPASMPAEGNAPSAADADAGGARKESPQVHAGAQDGDVEVEFASQAEESRVGEGASDAASTPEAARASDGGTVSAPPAAGASAAQGRVSKRPRKMQTVELDIVSGQINSGAEVDVKEVPRDESASSETPQDKGTHQVSQETSGDGETAAAAGTGSAARVADDEAIEERDDVPLRELPPSTPPVPPELDRETAPERPWFETYFNEDYQRTVWPPTDAQVSRQCTFIEAALRLAPETRVVDIGCGFGLQAVELARRGYKVSAVDLSPAMLRRAAVEAEADGVQVELVHHDFRKLRRDGEFDAAMCLGTTFGYFGDYENERALLAMRRMLRPGGKLLIDVFNRDYVMTMTPHLRWFEGDGCLCMEECEFEYESSRLVVKRSLIAEGSADGQRDVNYSIRLYSAHELRALLEQNGFRVLGISGQEATPDVFFGPTSPRVLIAAERIGSTSS